MTLIEIRDRIRTKAIAQGLTYTEIETLADTNLLENQTMPCLLWQYSGETNNFTEVGTEVSLNIYLLGNYPDDVKTESADYQRDFLVTQKNILRQYFYDWLATMQMEEGDDFLEILTTDEIPLAEKLSISSFLSIEFRVNISVKRDFCIDTEDIPTVNQVQVYFNEVLKYTQAANVDLQLTLKNQDGDDIAATFTGYNIVVNQAGSLGAMPTETGQTTVYVSNDDGDRQKGRLTSFFVLPYSNPFANTNRLTDTLGGQTYADNIVLDWSTWVDGKVLAYSPSDNSATTGNQTFDDWCLNSPYSIGGFSDWYVANRNQGITLMNPEYYGLDYSPFTLVNINTGKQSFLSTSAQSTSAYVIDSSSPYSYFRYFSKTTPLKALLVREFTVTGTTLS